MFRLLFECHMYSSSVQRVFYHFGDRKPVYWYQNVDKILRRMRMNPQSKVKLNDTKGKWSFTDGFFFGSFYFRFSFYCFCSQFMRWQWWLINWRFSFTKRHKRRINAVEMSFLMQSWTWNSIKRLQQQQWHQVTATSYVNFIFFCSCCILLFNWIVVNAFVGQCVNDNAIYTIPMMNFSIFFI